jgi:hypothetical protein
MVWTRTYFVRTVWILAWSMGINATQLLECVLVDTWLYTLVHFSSRMSYVSKLVPAAWVGLCLSVLFI